MSPFAPLLAADAAPETFVRRALALLESAFREMALLALADWERAGIASPELFQAVAGLQRPSWGSWNGLLSALRTARRNALRTAAPAARERIERAATLTRVLGVLDEAVGPDLAEALKPLAEIARTPSGKRLKLGDVLAMPISLRNRVAHDAPDDPSSGGGAAEALRPAVRLHAERDLPAAAGRAAPWLIRERRPGGHRPRLGSDRPGSPFEPTRGPPRRSRPVRGVSAAPRLHWVHGRPRRTEQGAVVPLE